MPVIYEYPGIPRFFIDADDDTICEYGTKRAVFFVRDTIVHAMDGTALFSVGREVYDNYLLLIDAAQAPRFYFDLFDQKPKALLRSEDNSQE